MRSTHDLPNATRSRSDPIPTIWRDSCDSRVSATIQPMRDWKILFVVFVMLNVAIIAFSAFLFLEINRGDIFLVEPTAPSGIDTVDRDELREALLSFEEKARQFEALKTKKPTLADPSL